MRHRSGILLSALLALAACGGDGPTLPSPGATGVSLVIAPGALLLPTAGDTQRLKAYAVGADGDSTEVTATFQSSAPDIVAISATGVATGGAALGSAHIIAQSGDLVSAPILVLRATPAAEARLVADDQVLAIEPVDSAAPYQAGWRYRVRLRGVTPSPTPGQVLLASGGAPVGGRVVAVAAAGGDLDVVLEIIPVSAMFVALSVNERLPLTHASLALTDASRAGLRLQRRLDGSIAGSTTRPSFNTAQVSDTFALGPFSCKAEALATLFPASINDYSFDLNFDLSYDVKFEPTFQHALVTGSITPRLSASPRITAELEGKAECRFHMATLHLPIGGPLALVVGGQVPLGVGFGLGGKVALGPVGYDALIQSSVAATFGLDCAAGCQLVTAITSTEPQKYFKLVMPSLTDLADATRTELAMSAFGYAELAIGNGFFEWAQFKAVGLKAGLEQKAELASSHAQAADPAYASSFALTPVLEAKAEANLEALANLLNINLATLTFAPALPVLARSPHGTLAITPASVAPGDGTALGELATFTVTLIDVTYLGAYAVEGLEIRWQKTDGTTTTLEPGRPGCTDLEAAQDQVTFTCQTDFLEADAGTQTFYAFVKTRIFGVPIPVPLEVALDGKATVIVGGAGGGGGITVVGASGFVEAGTSSPGGTPCDSVHTFNDTGSNVLPTRSLASQCSDSSQNYSGGTTSDSAWANLTYTIEPSGTSVHSISASGFATAIDERVPPLGPGGSAGSSVHTEFTFDLAHTTSITVSATGSGFDPDSPDSYGRVRLVRQSENNEVVFSTDLGSGDAATLSLPPGRYYLLADWATSVTARQDILRTQASITFGMTLTANP